MNKIDDYLKAKLPYIFNIRHGKFDLNDSMTYWTNILFERTLELIDVSGEGFATTELKKQLILNGMSCVRYSSVFDNVAPYFCYYGNMTGQFFGVPVTVNYTSPRESGNAIIGVDCVLVENTPLRLSLYHLIQRYAVILSHIDISIVSILVKMRMINNVYVAEDDDVIKCINKMYQNAFKGDFGTITNETGRGVELLKTTETNTESVTGLLEARENVMTAYFNDIGVQSAKSKKGNILVPEIESAKPRLLISLNDMLKSWKEGAEKIKQMFDITLTVKLTKEVDGQFKGGAGDDIRNDDK